MGNDRVASIGANQSLPKTRPEAIKLGLTRYFTGKPCKRGHVAARFAASYGCVECQALLLNREKQLAAQAKFRNLNREEINANARLARLQDPLKARQYSAKYRAKNREMIKERSKAEYLANPQAANSRWHTRRAKLLGADGVHTKEDIERIHALQGYKCVYCGVSTKNKKSVDHMTPLSKGGSNWPDNIQILCPKCNRSKSDRNDQEFRFLIENGLTAVNDNLALPTTDTTSSEAA